MQRNRKLVFTGTAVAATVMLATIFATPTQRSIVNASTIMHSLRQTSHHGLRLSFENVGEDGVRVDGRLCLLFDRPINLADLMEGSFPAGMGFDGVYLDARVALDESANEFAGMTLHAAIAVTEADSWVYVQSDDPSPLVREAGPMGFLVQDWLTGGLLLDLTGVIESEDLLGRGKETGTDAESGELAGLAEIAEAGEVAGDIEDDKDAEIDALVKSFLSGSATREQIDHIVSKLEEVAAEVRVDQREPDLYVLTARDFTGAAGEADAEEAAWMARMVMEIAYRDGVGVEWARLTNVGPYQGSVRFEFIDEPADEDRVIREDYIEEGVTTVFDLAGLIKTIEAMGGAFDNPDDDG